MPTIIDYPGLRAAALEIGYGSGIINRVHPEVKYLRECDEVMWKYPGGDLERWNTWLLALSAEDLNTACCGETDDMTALMQNAPTGSIGGQSLDDLLNEFFEHEADPVTGRGRRKHWRCYHCGEVFTTARWAAQHFGADSTALPACRIAAHHGHLIHYIRDLEDLITRYRAEDSQEEEIWPTRPPVMP